jgi:hypothetical protein
MFSRLDEPFVSNKQLSTLYTFVLVFMAYAQQPSVYFGPMCFTCMEGKCIVLYRIHFELTSASPEHLHLLLPSLCATWLPAAPAELHFTVPVFLILI